MQSIEIYGRNFCPFVKSVRAFCVDHGLPFVLRDTWQDQATENEMFSRNPPSGATPQLFVGDRAIGGHAEFFQAVHDGSLQQIIGGS